MKTLELHGSGQGGTELRKLMFNISTMEELGEVLSSRDHFRENLQTALLSLMGSIPVARGALLLRDRNSGDLVLAATRGTEARPGLRIALPVAPTRTLLRLRRPLSVHAQVPVLSPWMRRTTVLRELGAEQALISALNVKPKRGCYNRTERFYNIGG